MFVGVHVGVVWGGGGGKWTGLQGGEGIRQGTISWGKFRVSILVAKFSP